ncbi:unnamed protein product [Calypogeia fissa]
MLAFKQSLTPSRSYGVLNVLKAVQRKTLQMSMEAAAGKVPITGSGAREYGSMKSSIEKKLQEALAPTLLEVDDVSHQHAGHAGVEKGAKETHFNVKVISDKFTGSSLVKRHRLVYGLLDDELKNGVHALSLVTKTPSEPM